MSFNVFGFPVSFFVWDCTDTVRCWRTGAASCRAAATELFGRKNLEKSTLAGPCFRVPKSAEYRLRSKVPPEYTLEELSFYTSHWRNRRPCTPQRQGRTPRHSNVGPLVVGRGDVVLLHIPHLSLYDALVKTYGCKRGFPWVRCEFFWFHPRQSGSLFSHRELQTQLFNLRQLREFEREVSLPWFPGLQHRTF